MDGSIACVARRLASSAFRGQVSLSDDIRGGSSNAPHREEKPRRMTGLKTVMHGATQGHSIQAPPVHIRGPTRPNWGRGITLSGMARFAQIAVVPSPGPSFCLAAGRGAYAIRALRHLCLGIVSGRLGHLESLDLSPFMVDTLKAPARPGLSFTLCVSAGTEPGGKLLRWLGGHDRPPSGVMAPSPGPSENPRARVGAPSRSAPCLKEKPRLPKKTGPELDSVRPLNSPVSPSAPTQHVLSQVASVIWWH